VLISVISGKNTFETASYIVAPIAKRSVPATFSLKTKLLLCMSVANADAWFYLRRSETLHRAEGVFAIPLLFFTDLGDW